MPKQKRQESPPKQPTLAAHAWSTGFALAGELARETSQQLEALLVFLGGLGSGAMKLAHSSNQRLSTLVVDGLAAGEARGLSLPETVRARALDVVSTTRARAAGAAERASATAKTLVAPTKEAA